MYLRTVVQNGVFRTQWAHTMGNDKESIERAVRLGKQFSSTCLLKEGIRMCNLDVPRELNVIPDADNDKDDDDPKMMLVAATTTMIRTTHVIDDGRSIYP